MIRHRGRLTTLACVTTAVAGSSHTTPFSLTPQYEQFSIDVGKREEGMVEKQKLEVSALKEQIAALRLEVDQHATDTTVTQLHRDLEDVRLQFGRAKEEAEGLRKEKSVAVVEQERAALKHGREMGNLQMRFQAQSGDMQDATKKAEAAERSLQDALREGALHEKKFADMTAEVLRLKKTAESRATERGQEAESVRVREDSARDEYTKRTNSLQEKLHGMKIKLEEAEEAKLRSMQGLEALRESSNKAISSSNSELEQTLGMKDEQLDAVQQRAEALEERAEQLERERDEALAQQEKEDAGVRGELRYTERERDSLETKYNILQEQEVHRAAEAEAKEIEMKDTEEELVRLQDKHRELLAREHALTLANAELQDTVKYLEDDIGALSNDQEQQRAKFIEDTDTAREELAVRSRQAGSVQQKAVSEAKRTAVAAKSAFRKLKKKCEVYKRKAIKIHQREQLLRQQMQLLVQHAEGEQQKYEAELSSWRSQKQQDPLYGGAEQKREGRTSAVPSAGSDRFAVLVEQQREQRQEMGSILQRLDALT